LDSLTRIRSSGKHLLGLINTVDIANGPGFAIDKQILDIYGGRIWVGLELADGAPHPCGVSPDGVVSKPILVIEDQEDLRGVLLVLTRTLANKNFGQSSCKSTSDFTRHWSRHLCAKTN